MCIGSDTVKCIGYMDVVLVVIQINGFNVSVLVDVLYRFGNDTL